MNEKTIKQIMPDNKNTKAVYWSKGKFLIFPIMGFALVGFADYKGDEEILPITIEEDSIGPEWGSTSNFVGYTCDGYSLERLKEDSKETIKRLKKREEESLKKVKEKKNEKV